MKGHSLKIEHEVIVLDDGLIEKNIEVLKGKFTRSYLVRTAGRGVAAIYNKALKTVSGTDILFISTKVLLTEDSLVKMLETLHTDRQIAVVSCLTNWSDRIQSIDMDGEWKDICQQAGVYNRETAPISLKRYLLDSYCVLVKREILEKFGLFDENFRLSYAGMWDDYLIRLLINNYQAMLCCNVIVYRWPKDFAEELEVNAEEEYCRQKWQLPANFTKLFPLYKAMRPISVKENELFKKVLCINCHFCDFIFLQNSFLNCEYHIVTDNLLEYKTLDGKFKYYASDIESTLTKVKEQTFDYIFCNIDLQNWKELKECLQNKLKPGAVLYYINDIYADTYTQLLIEPKKKRSKKEILFLPYKAAMWDSMESIWQAAVKDNNCEVFVVPIPYCTKGGEGSFTKWHCERELFPPEVPTVDYRQYKLAEHCPDVIYIHNPYDESNTVTQVSPEYFSYNLKKYTPLLAYVPYFVIGGAWPRAHTKQILYHYVDKIFIQREKMLVLPYESDPQKDWENHIESCFPHHKLVGLGSPKIDRILQKAEKDLMPPEWKNIFANRKVVLYNLSLNALLTYNVALLKKVRYILECFAERKGEIAILFRPHPLFKSTILTLENKTELLTAYEDIEQFFQEQNLGVIDYSADIDRAIVCSDAYIGDSGTSILQMFGVLGKPIFAADLTILLQEKTMAEKCLVYASNAFNANNFFAQDGKLYFVAEELNVFCEMDIFTGRVTPLLQLTEKVLNFNLYSQVLAVDNKLIFIPMGAPHICQYDGATGQFIYTALRKPIEGFNFKKAIKYGRYLYLIPYRYNAIVQYDIWTQECRYHSECLKDFWPDLTQDDKELFGDGYLTEDGNLLLPALRSNKVLEINLNDFSYQVYKVGDIDCDGAYIVRDGDKYWLIPWQNKKIRCWDKNQDTCKIFAEYPVGYECDIDWFTHKPYLFSASILSNGGIWLFPCYGNMILRLDLATGTLEKVDIDSYKPHQRASITLYQQMEVLGATSLDENHIAVQLTLNRDILVIDTREFAYCSIPCQLSENELSKLALKIDESFGDIEEFSPYMVREDSIMRTPRAYIDYLLIEKHNKKPQIEAYKQFINNADGSCGAKIHDYVMEQIDEKI